MKIIKITALLAFCLLPLWTLIGLMLYGYNDLFNLALIPLGIMLVRSIYENYK